MEQQIEQLNALLQKSKDELSVLLAERKTRDEAIKRLSRIIDECETSIILLGKYSEIATSATDIPSLIAEDNLRLLSNFEGKYDSLIRASVLDTKEQIRNAGIELLKKSEAMGAKERAVNELITVLTSAGDTATADLIRTTALNAKIVDKL